MNLPWHQGQWQRMVEAEAAGRLGHALLLRGPAGVGKARFAARLARRHLCTADPGTERPCGACRGCALERAGSHPDLLRLVPEEGKRSVGVDQVRAVIHGVGLTTRFSPVKVVLVPAAEELTPPAANTLLKTLEEPPGPCLFVLVCARPALLPQTVRSRCQALDFPLPGAAQALEWLVTQEADRPTAESALREARGAPLHALALVRDAQVGGLDRLVADLSDLLAARRTPTEIAAGWRGMGLDPVVVAMLGVVQDLARSGAADRAPPGPPAMQDLARTLDLPAMLRLRDALVDLRRVTVRRIGLNEKLALESLAAAWTGAAREAAARRRTAPA